MKTKAGEEPRIVILVDDEDEPTSIFFVADTLELCQIVPPAVDLAVLTLLGTYFLANLDFPVYCSQLLGLFQHHCLSTDFPESKRKMGFNTLIQLVQ